MVDVHFDFFDKGNKIILGVVMVEDFEVILQETKAVDKREGQNFYHWTLEAMHFALTYLVEDDVEEVTFKNQQKLIFEWLVKDSYKENYEDHYGKIKKLLYRLVEEGGTFGYEVVKGDKNRAKKYLKSNFKKSAVSGGAGDLTSLFVTGDTNKGKGTFKSTPDNVIDFLERTRKEA